MATCGTTAGCTSAVASTCGGGIHRSRTPKLLESTGGTPPVAGDNSATPPVEAADAVSNVLILDTSVSKNWYIELTGSYVDLQLKMGTKSGRRGTIVLKNDMTAAGDGDGDAVPDGDGDDSNTITNIRVTVPSGANTPLFVGAESAMIKDGLSLFPDEHVQIRYYLNGPSGSALFPVVELLTSR